MRQKRAVELIYSELGRRIQAARQSHRPVISQAELGRRLPSGSMTRAAIANIEAGKQRIMAHTILDIAMILKVPVANLLPEMSNVADNSGHSKQGDDIAFTKALADAGISPSVIRNITKRVVKESLP